MLHLLQCLTTSNIIEYLNESELNNLNVVFRQNATRCILSSISFVGLFVHFAMPCLIKPDMHHTWLRIMPCLCGGCLLCFCFFPVLLLRVGSVNVAFVRIRSTTTVCLLHGLVLLPCGISSKMTITLDMLASCSVPSLCCGTYHLFTMPPKLPCQPLTFSPFLANHCLAMLPLCSAPLIALLVAGEVWRLLHVGQDYVGISQYLLFN